MAFIGVGGFSEWEYLPETYTTFNIPLDAAGPYNNVITSDPAGNVYIASTETRTIYKIEPNGTVTDDWVTVPGGDYPRTIIHGGGYIYLLTSASKIYKIATADATVSNVAISGLPANPHTMALTPNGNFLIVTFDYAIRKVVISTGAIGVYPDIYPVSPYYAAADNTYAYIGDVGTDTIIRVTLTGGATTTFSGFIGPWGFAMDHDNNLYFSNVDSPSTLERITPAGVQETVYDGFAVDEYPSGIAVSKSGEKLYFATSTGRFGRLLLADETVTETWEQISGGATEFILETDVNGNVWAGGCYTSTVYKLDGDAIVTVPAGFNADASGTAGFGAVVKRTITAGFNAAVTSTTAFTETIKTTIRTGFNADTAGTSGFVPDVKRYIRTGVDAAVTVTPVFGPRTVTLNGFNGDASGTAGFGGRIVWVVRTGVNAPVTVTPTFNPSRGISAGLDPLASPSIVVTAEFNGTVIPAVAEPPMGMIDEEALPGEQWIFLPIDGWEAEL